MKGDRFKPQHRCPQSLGRPLARSAAAVAPHQSGLRACDSPEPPCCQTRRRQGFLLQQAIALRDLIMLSQIRTRMNRTRVWPRSFLTGFNHLVVAWFGAPGTENLRRSAHSRRKTPVSPITQGLTLGNDTPMLESWGSRPPCDETAAAVVERQSDGSGQILSNIVRSQTPRSMPCSAAWCRRSRRAPMSMRSTASSRAP